MTTTRGILRYVGGRLSKQDNAVTLSTASAVLAVRGGAFMLNQQPNGAMEAIFLYGRGLTITGRAGVSQTLERPGFGVTTRNSCAARMIAPSAQKRWAMVDFAETGMPAQPRAKLRRHQRCASAISSRARASTPMVPPTHSASLTECQAGRSEPRRLRALRHCPER